LLKEFAMLTSITPVLADYVYIGGGTLGLILLIVVIVVLMRR
jgi:hypothetical protein